MTPFDIGIELKKISTNGPIVIYWDSNINNLVILEHGFAVVFCSHTLTDKIDGINIRMLINKYIQLHRKTNTHNAISIWADSEYVYADIALVYLSKQEALTHYYLWCKGGAIKPDSIIDLSRKRYRDIAYDTET